MGAGPGSLRGAAPPMSTQAPRGCCVARDNFNGAPYGPWALDLVAFEAVTYLPLPPDEDPVGWVRVRTVRGEGWVPPTYLVNILEL